MAELISINNKTKIIGYMIVLVGFFSGGYYYNFVVKKAPKEIPSHKTTNYALLSIYDAGKYYTHKDFITTTSLFKNGSLMYNNYVLFNNLEEVLLIFPQIRDLVKQTVDYIIIGINDEFKPSIAYDSKDFGDKLIDKYIEE